MTTFCPNCGKPNTDTAALCVACSQVLKYKQPSKQPPKQPPKPKQPPVPDPRVFADEVEERAWMTFAAGAPPPGVHWDAERAQRVAEWADKMLEEFRSRRRPEGKDGPYR